MSFVDDIAPDKLSPPVVTGIPFYSIQHRNIVIWAGLVQKGFLCFIKCNVSPAFCLLLLKQSLAMPTTPRPRAGRSACRRRYRRPQQPLSINLGNNCGSTSRFLHRDLFYLPSINNIHLTTVVTHRHPCTTTTDFATMTRFRAEEMDGSISRPIHVVQYLGLHGLSVELCALKAYRRQRERR